MVKGEQGGGHRAEVDPQLLRLASLLVTVFELGNRKAERDVLDDICCEFDVDLAALERTPRGPFHSKKISQLRERVAAALAQRASRVEALLGAVGRHGRPFLDMLNDIYSVLSQAESTAGGNCEHFRVRAAEVDLGIPMSPAFLEQVRRLVHAVEQIEIGRIDLDALSKFLLPDGDFYGSWPDRPQRGEQRNLARDISYLPAVRTHVHVRSGAEWTKARRVLDSTLAAAQAFIDAALELVAAHVRALRHHDGAASGIDRPEELEGESVDENFQEQSARMERRLLREVGRLRGGIRCRVAGLSDALHSLGNLDVLTEQLLAAPNSLGASPNCLVSADSTIVPNFYGSTIGSLACLCGIWKAGTLRMMNKDDEIARILAADEPQPVAEWCTALRRDVDAATAWLRNEVWTPLRTEDRARLVEDFEEYLNLPLWRQRWLLYEVWLVCVTIDAARSSGWNCSLPFGDETSASPTVKGVRTWVLPKGPATGPCGYLQLAGPQPSLLEIWYQARHKRSDIDMMPDVAVLTPNFGGARGRDLLVVEGKDRYRMPARSRGAGALEIGQKYRQASRARVTWVVNYCAFADANLSDPSRNYGDPWEMLFFGEKMRPGSIPERFAQTITAALRPLTLETPVQKGRPRTLIVVCDTTGSMHGNLDAIWDRLCTLFEDAKLQNDFLSFHALLFGDHDPKHSEPYLVRHVGPMSSLLALAIAARAEPRTSGGDQPEALEDAMRACVRLVQALREPACVLAVSDAPPHHASECPEGLDFNEEVNALLRTGSLCFVVTDWLSSPAARNTWAPFEHQPGVHHVELRSPERLCQLLGATHLLTPKSELIGISR